MTFQARSAFVEWLAATLFFMLGMILSMTAGLPTWLPWGAALAVAVLIFVRWSGAHVNPAISWEMAMVGQLSPGALIPYIFAQMIGGAVAVLLVTYHETGSLGTSLAQQFVVRPAPGISRWDVFWLEAGGTCILGLAVALAPRVDAWARWLVVGGGLSLAIYLFGDKSGGSMNPMRALVPFVLSPDAWSRQSTLLTLVGYVLGPIAGTTAAGLVAWTIRKIPLLP